MEDGVEGGGGRILQRTEGEIIKGMNEGMARPGEGVCIQ